jgi:hypothetical protein
VSPSHGAPFRGFRDDEESPFFCAAGLTPEQTWDISIDQLAQLLAQLGPVAKSGAIEMSTGLLCSWHGDIFGKLFPGDAFVGKHDPYRPLAEHITDIIAGTKRA